MLKVSFNWNLLYCVKSGVFKVWDSEIILFQIESPMPSPMPLYDWISRHSCNQCLSSHSGSVHTLQCGENYLQCITFTVYLMCYCETPTRPQLGFVWDHISRETTRKGYMWLGVCSVKSVKDNRAFVNPAVVIRLWTLVFSHLTCTQWSRPCSTANQTVMTNKKMTFGIKSCHFCITIWFNTFWLYKHANRSRVDSGRYWKS